MAAAIDGIDHALVGVRDLDAAAAAWRRLGFAITPRGRHIGWGTANYCIMFGADYIELLGIVDPTQPVQGLDRFLDEREGLLGLALATGDADAAHDAFRAAGIADGPPRDLARLLELPEGSVRPEFRLVHPRDAAALGVNGFVCQHLTPALLRRPEWLQHPNGARRIRALTAAVAAPSALAPVWRALVGEAAVHESSEGVTVRLGAAFCHFGRAEPGLDGLLGLAVEVADPDAAAGVLDAAGIRFDRNAGAVDVDPRDATGVALSLVGGG